MSTHFGGPHLTCDQAYRIWSTEPELLRVLDLRDSVDYAAGHIPGARWISESQLEAELVRLQGRLALLVVKPEKEIELLSRYGERSDVAFLRDCNQWIAQMKPIAGASVESILKRSTAMNAPLIFHQMFEAESSTYTYLLADSETKEAALIDPVLETVDRDLKLIQELGLKLVYVLDTHVHADHVTGAGEIRKRTGAKTAISMEGGVDCADIPLEDGQELRLGKRVIKVIATPGHTNTCMSFFCEGRVFTGDALLIRGTGRTDFQQGSSETLYKSIHEQLFKLPDETLVYPGHDYRGHTVSTIRAEKEHNPRVGGGRSLEEFKKTMSELKLANPKKIHEAVPANMACGRTKDSRAMHPQIVDGIPEITPEDLNLHAGKVRVIDVRRPEEFNNELGHVAGAELVTLGPELTAFLEKGNRAEEIVFTCRSGGRSGQATIESMRMGYKFTMNMTGGMLRWNEQKLPVERK